MEDILAKIRKLSDEIEELVSQRDELQDQLEDAIFNAPNLTPRQKQRRREKYNRQTSGGKFPEFYKGKV